jgi:4'-phosphopantetheinyl transferase
VTHDFPARRGRGIVTLAAPALGVRIWRCDLADATHLAARLATLSDAERDRAARFGHAALRDRYVLGRGALRAILGGLLGVPPAAVPIVRGPRGRPQLRDGALDFNVSHTDATAIVGVVRDARIGVDIEARGRTINAIGIARKFLSAGERARLPATDAEAMRRQVLKLWTCKEAMSKATGDALSAPFASIDVDTSAGVRILGGPGDYEPDRWSLHSVNSGALYVATVAVWRAPACGR